MLVPLSWLRDFAPFELDPFALGEVFDNLGMIVEGIRRVGEGLDDVVVGRVTAILAIPGADRIREVLVDTGGPDPVAVVCGAWNFAEGDLVPLATVGAALPGDLEVGLRRIKGVTSNGMICSARELSLGDDHEGILVLPPGLAEPGTPFGEATGIEADVVYDLAIETNRPDALSIVGVARDAAAKLHLPFAIPQPLVTPVEATSPAGEVMTVEVEAPDLCPRFTATLLTGAIVGSAPSWVARRLTLAGMRAINNVVDASNYVMLELGQPSHPYDLAKLPGHGLVVRTARRGETVLTLDGVVRTLGDGPYPDCLICDAEQAPVGIAGIMGGASTEIDASTSTVLLEAAYFDRMAIARTSKRIGLRSEASVRFERGCDPAGIERAVMRVAEIVGGAVGEQIVVGPPPPPRPVRVRTARVNAVLGTDLGDEEVETYLAPIGFAARRLAPGVHEVTIPTYRPDAEGEIDVVEEVARHHGYAQIPRAMPRSPHVGGLTSRQQERRLVRQVLVGAGLTEAVGPMLIGPGDHARAGLPEGPGQVVEADDPLVREESVMRASLLPGLLRAVAHNVGQRIAEIPLFEIGHVYLPPRPGEVLPDERERVGVVLAGAGADASVAAAVIRTLLGALRIEGVQWAAAPEVPGLHPTRTSRLIVGDSEIGFVGEVSPSVVADHDLPGRIGWAELELGALLAAPRRDPAMRPVSRFPSSDVDLAFEVEDAVPAALVEGTLREAGGELLVGLWLFDVYRGEQVGRGHRSLAYRLRFCALDHTLTDAEVAEIRRRCIAAVEQAHGASLRG